MITLSAFTQSEPVNGEIHPLLPLCPVRPLRIYVKCTKNFRLSEQLFVCYGGHTKGLRVSKQRLSHWVVDAIALAYDTQNTNCLSGCAPTPRGASLPPGRGQGVYLWRKSARQQDGPRRTPLPGFIIWMFLEFVLCN